jgi:nitrogen regulatory protein PII
MKHELVISIVNQGFADEVIAAANDNGARGATIIAAKGSGLRAEMIYGVKIDPEKELVLMVVERERAQAIIQGIYERVGLNTSGSGICFAMPIDNVVGLHSPNAKE